jgi:hypothetical protein
MSSRIQFPHIFVEPFQQHYIINSLLIEYLLSFNLFEGEMKTTRTVE